MYRLNHRLQAHQLTENEKHQRKGFLKLIFDIGFCGDKRSGGIGVVIRDYNGLLIRAMHVKLSHVLNGKAIEALAATKALDFAQDLGLRFTTYHP